MNGQTDRLMSLKTARTRYFDDEISDSMLRKLIRIGELPRVQIGRRVMLAESDVVAYIARQRRQATAGGEVLAFVGAAAVR